jgi:prepilin-type N-terminal cleavage/methylation domain-containing protein
MLCRITSGLAHQSVRSRCRAFTLVELLIAAAIGTLVLAAIMALSLFSARSFAALSNYVDLDMKSRNALDKMTREIRQANTLTSFSSTQLAFVGTDPVTSNSYTLTYTWDSANPTNKTLTRTKSPGDTEVLLSGCDTLSWSMFQRNLTNDGTYDYAPQPTTNVNECKLLRLTWVCSRRILGKTANTESVQSSEVVIRKK